MKKTKKTRKPEPKNKQTLVVLLLDRTGSMEACKQETISGFNGYIDGLKDGKEADNIRLTMVQFDTQSTDTLSDCVALGRVPRLTATSYQPRGGTNLYDAMGKTIESVEQKGRKVLFVTLTDGEENSSSIWTLASLRSLISRKEVLDHWTFAYIGVGIEGFNSTTRISIGTISASNVMRSTHKDTLKAYRKMGQQTACYASSIGAGGQSVKGFWAKKEDDEA